MSKYPTASPHVQKLRRQVARCVVAMKALREAWEVDQHDPNCDCNLCNLLHDVEKANRSIVEDAIHEIGG